MAFHCIFFLILFVADSLAVNKIPLSAYKKIQGLSTYDFAKNHLYKKQRDFASDQVDGGRVSNTGPSGSRPDSGVVRPGHGLQAPQGSGSDGLRRELYPGESLIFTDNGSIQPRNVMAQSLLAEPAGCSPMPQPVHLPPDLDPMVIYYPSCVLVNRCTGCCSPDSVVSCQATSRRNKPVHVLKQRYTGGEMFASEGIVELIVEEDEECDCLCTVKATSCNPSVHWYDSNTCSCRCTNEHLASSSSCIHPRTWSASLCACTCPPVTCPPGHAFHETTCTCQSPFALIASTTSDPCEASKRCGPGYKGVTRRMGCVCLRQRIR